MNFSQQKLMLLRPSKEKFLSTFFISLFVAAAFLLPYMITDEGYFIFYGDFNVQQIPFYQNCHQAIREGNIFWSWTTDLGANFIGSYSFYLLGSPFFWLTLPFPNSVVPYLMGPLLILKFGCASLTAYAYIRRFTRTPEAAQLGGILYAFSGFSVYNIFFNHFHEAIILFPLLLLSLELLMTENRRFIFALTVCLCAIVNYFFFFGMVIFTIIYFFVRVFSKALKISFSRFAVIAFEAVLGLALSAVIILPCYVAIVDNSRISNVLLGWNAIMYGKEQIYANIMQCFFFPPDIPARPVFFPGAEVKWSSLGGWLPLFSTVGLFTWFSQRNHHWLKRLIGTCIFMALVPILNSAFYAFNSAYYARWFYMPILMICLATVSLTEDSTINWSIGYKWVLGITIAVAVVIGLFPQKNSDGKLIFGLYSQGSSKEYRLMYALRFWIACLIAIMALVILGMALKILKTNRKRFYKVVLPCTCIITIVYANVFVICGRTHSYDTKNVVIDQLIEGEVDLGDASQFRVDVYGGVDNAAMFLQLPTINAFHSIVPSSIMEFYKFIGAERNVASRPGTEYYAIRPLLSVKYLLNRKDGDSFINQTTHKTEMHGYSYLKTENDYYIYENKNYIPYGFSYEYYMSEDFCENYSKEKRANLMLKAILLSDQQIEKYGNLLTNIEELSLNYIDSSDYENATTLSFSDIAFDYDCAQLAKTGADYFETDDTGFSAIVIRESENLVFFSVPYDQGWTALVNGQETEIEKVNAGFMAVKVPAGKSEIRFNYKTPGLINGIKITTVSSAVLILYILCYLIWNKNHKTTSLYPEGEELLKKWRYQELTEIQNEFEKDETLIKKSYLDNVSAINIPPLNNNYNGGFKININAFDQPDKNPKED